MKKIFILIATILILGIIFSFKIINTNNNNINNKKLKAKTTNELITNSILANTTSNETTKQHNTVEIISHKKNQYGKIEAIIKNNTNKQLKELVIKAQCYDKNGNNLGTYSGGQYNVNTTDNYKISIYTNSDTSRYTLTLEYK